MTSEVLFGTATLLQVVAAVLALRLMRATRHSAWAALAFVSLLLAIRNAIAIHHVRSDPVPRVDHQMAIILALAIAGLIVAGLAWLTPLLRRGRRMHEEHELARDDREQMLRAHAAEMEEANQRLAELARHSQAAETAAREHEHFVQSVLETSPAMIYVYDAGTGRSVYISQRGAAFLGYTTREMQDLDRASIFALMHVEDVPSAAATVERLVQLPTGTILEVEYRIRGRDGVWHRMLDRQTVLTRTPDGGIQVLGTAVDVSERRRIEEALTTVTGRLRELLHSSGTIIFSSTPTPPFTATFVSENVTSILGWPASAFVDAGTFFAENVHPADREALIAGVAEVVRHGHGVVDFRFRTADHQYRWLRDQLRVGYDEAGVATQIVGSCTDVTELKRIEEQLRRSERLASIGTLAAGIAHEINNPVAAMVMSAQLALALHGRSDETAMVADCLANIVGEGQRCGRIVKGILQFAREEPTEKWPMDLNAVVGQATGRLRAYTDEHEVVLELRLVDDPLRVLANPVQLEQVIANLVRNAVEAGGTRIVVTTGTAGADVELVIEDDGPGIADPAHARVFDPFYTTRQRQGGTGLGLSMCHGIVVEHGGRMDMTSVANEGTTVRITLPADLQTEPAQTRVSA